jgi:predicted metal-dependent hydrolase
MNTKGSRMKVLNLEIHTVKKDIKNMHLGVYPPYGRVRVAAPIKTTDETIKLLVISKMAWIKKQQAKFDRQERQTKREYVSGESHFFMGNRHLLNVVHANSAPKIEIKRKARIDMYINPQATLKKREELMDSFYRSELKKQIPILIRKWEKKTGVHVKEFKIRKMKTKWGTCNPKCRRVWFNLELAKKPLRCIEFVLVHEMAHLIEKNHTEEFKFLMKSFMKQWDQYKEELNNSPLGYSKWEYSTEQTDV